MHLPIHLHLPYIVAANIKTILSAPPPIASFILWLRFLSFKDFDSVLVIVVEQRSAVLVDTV